MKPLNQEGKELRDRIAIEMLKSMIEANTALFHNLHIHEPMAYRAYKLADAMLKERDKAP